MRFAPKTNEEIQTMNLIDPGIYSFEVIEAKEDKSKSSGKDMIVLKLKIWDKNGHERIVFDYLLEQMAHKLRHFAETTGLIDKYNLGYLNSDDCLYKSGHLDLIISKDKNGQYADKNSVKDYVVKEKKDSETMPIPASTKDDPFDDLIPF